jgi:uncharacterized membrane protein
MNPLFKPAPDEVFAHGVAQPSSPWVGPLHKPVFIAFLVSFGVAWISLWLEIPFAERGLEWVFWLAAATTSVVGLARRLPAQNVLMSSLLIGAISLGISVAAEETGIPFGLRVYTGALGPKVLGVPWSVPLIWLVVIVNARGVARLVMRPWRKTTYYGFRVIGLACLLAVLFDAGLEPFAVRVKSYWLWETRGHVLSWYSAPCVNSLGWFVSALAILGLATPWLINKQPAKQPADYHPLVLWLLLNSYFATGNASHRLWPAVSLTLVANAIVTIFAVRGARG